MKRKSTLISALLLASLVSVPQVSAATKICTSTQAIEEGPYYLSSTPTRSDITDGQEGKTLILSFKVVDTKCKPIKSARIDIWYANAQGIYSGVASIGDDLGAGVNSGNFLRGTQYTNATDMVLTRGGTDLKKALMLLSGSKASFTFAVNA